MNRIKMILNYPKVNINDPKSLLIQLDKIYDLLIQSKEYCKVLDINESKGHIVENCDIVIYR